MPSFSLQLAVQEVIVQTMQCLEDKITCNEQINDNLEQQAQSYFQELFVDNADPEWAIGTISDLGAVVGGSTPSKAKPEYYTESGIAWITPKDLSINKSKFVSHGENDITELGLKNSMRLIHNKNVYALGLDQYTWNEVPNSHQVKDRADKLKRAGLWQKVRDRYLEKKNMYLFRQDHNHPSFVVYVEAVNEVYSRYFNRGGGYSVQSIFRLR